MNQMPQNVQITPVQCNKSNHQNEIIRMLCLSAQCQENSAFCFLCSVKGHLKCREESILAQDIPKLLTDIQELKLDMVALEQKFNQQFKSALSRIEELDVQISQYRETPNLTNLNQIGKNLRTFNQEQFINNFVASLNKLQTDFEKKHIKQKVVVSCSDQKYPNRDYKYPNPSIQYKSSLGPTIPF